jgi:hypothetical protein
MNRAGSSTVADKQRIDEEREKAHVVLSCMKEYLFRETDWRWRLAHLPVDRWLSRRPESKDPWVTRIRQHLAYVERSPKSRRSSKRCRFDQAIHEAHQIRSAPDRLIPAELEAWILTGEPAAFIAARCELDEDVVATYENVFFDVRPRLNATGYILNAAIGPSYVQGFSLNDLGAIWRFCAYMRGCHELADILTVFPGNKVRPWSLSPERTPAQKAALISSVRRRVLTMCLRGRDLSVADSRNLILLQAILKAKIQREQESRSVGRGIVPALDPCAGVVSTPSEPGQDNMNLFDSILEDVYMRATGS